MANGNTNARNGALRAICFGGVKITKREESSKCGSKPDPDGIVLINIYAGFIMTLSYSPDSIWSGVHLLVLQQCIALEHDLVNHVQEGVILHVMHHHFLHCLLALFHPLLPVQLRKFQALVRQRAKHLTLLQLTSQGNTEKKRMHDLR